MSGRKIPDQVLRLAVLFAIAAAALVIARHRFVPESFGELGHYRASVMDSILAQPIRFAGLPACLECHPDVGEVKAASYHRGLSCEVCHGAAAAHAEDPGSFLPEIRRTREDCLHCHEYLPSRPTGFPQVIERVHNPMKPCAGCHDPHDPTPHHPPGECSACHATIARTLSTSHHNSLDCGTCHTSRPEHKENPRLALPTKPSGREFCGKCHAPSAGGGREIPRVDMDSHGGRYLCWQCHYPHHPEAR